jgi:hypothetical protein
MAGFYGYGDEHSSIMTEYLDQLNIVNCKRKNEPCG